MGIEHRFEVRDLADMERLGRAMAHGLYPGLMVCLDGELGAGKTTLVQAIGRGLGIGFMSSPSFLIVKEYDSEPPLVHVDLYRLEGHQVDHLALWEYLDEGRVVLVEWASRMDRGPYRDRWDMEISMGDHPESRWIKASALSPDALAYLEVALASYREGNDLDGGRKVD